jgi:hypothetical protein
MIAAVPSRTWTLRMAALMGAGAFGVHQLRFALAPDNGRSLHAHGYLTAVGAALVGVLLFTLAAALSRMARGVVEEAPRLRRLWAGTSVSLIAVYCVQETIEGLLTHGNTTGMFAGGGWIALPLALAIGLAIALVMRGAAAASAVVAGTRHAPSLRVAIAPFAVLPRPWSPRRSRACARHLAARGPPAALA